MNLVATAAPAADRPFGGPTSLASSLTLFTLVAFYVVDRVAVRRASGDRRARGDPSDRTYAWIVAWQLAGLVALLIAPRVLPGLDLPAWLWIPGLLWAWVGITLRVWAIRTLGADFQRVVAVAPGQAVVATGPYRYVRHPSYTGVLLTYAGLGLAQANIASIVAGVGLPLVGYVRRIHIEERALINGLGQRYEEYAAGRSRLVPHLW
jgi:protein-S-isoprenylcysteine O-methyltransferase Ste14